MSLEITSQSFLYAITFFLFLVLIQLSVWRLMLLVIGEIRSSIVWLFFIFLLIPLALLSISKEVAGTFLLICVGLSYVISFPAAMARSPSLEILTFVYKRKKASEIEILSHLGTDKLLENRVFDLKKDDLVRENVKGLRLTLKGKTLAWVFLSYRKILGLKVGEG